MYYAAVFKTCQANFDIILQCFIDTVSDQVLIHTDRKKLLLESD